MERLERKIDRRLVQWAENLDHQPLIIKIRLAKQKQSNILQ